MKKLGTSLLLCVSFSSMAQVMDLETHNTLIQKIERGYDSQSKLADSVDLRLADLYADRARIKSLKESEQGCSDCLASKKDRQIALKKYLRLFEILRGPEQERILAQIVQMNRLITNNFAKEKFYNKIIAGKGYGKSLKARAYLALAEMSFYGGNFKSARQLYRKGTGLNSRLNTFLVRYRLAWCALNLGEVTSAKSQLIAILKNKNDLKKDPSLQADMSKDLAVFFAKGKVGILEIKQLHRLSPVSEAKNNLVLLGSELDRLGQPLATTVVNRYVVAQFPSSAIEKSHLTLKTAQAEYNMNRKVSAARSFKSAMVFFRKGDCSKDTDCPATAERARKMIIGWRQDEKIKPSARLVDVFGDYVQTFPQDSEISFWGAQAAEFNKRWRTSQSLYGQTVKSLMTHPEPLTTKTKKLLNVAAVSGIRVAESSKTIANKREAYKLYLKAIPQGEKAFDCRYQLAFMDYQEKRYGAATSQFSALVNNFKNRKALASIGIAKKSAHLVLDILAIQKRNDEIVLTSKQYAQIFPKHSEEFRGIYRKAVYNGSAISIERGRQDAMLKSLKMMKQISFRGVPEEEQIALLEKQSVLAEKTRSLPEVNRTAAKLLTYKSLTPKSRAFALAQLVWAAEISMNFGRAYTLTQQQVSKRPSKKELLRLALLAELSGKNPHPHYESYLEQKCGILEGNQIRAKIVQSHRAPWMMIKKYLPQLKRSPQLLSELALKTYIQYQNQNAAKKVLAAGSVSKKPAGQRLNMLVQIPEFQKIAKQLESHRISTRSDSAIQKGTAFRIQKIDEITVIANRAINSGATPLMLAAMTTLQRENGRLYNDLMALPLPRGLNAVEKQQYSKMLKVQARPFAEKNNSLIKELEILWKKQTYVQSLKAEMQGAPALARGVIAKEAQFLLPYAPDSYLGELKRLSQAPGMNATELLNARNRVQNNPFGEVELVKLKAIALDHGKYAHVAFADQRLQNLRQNGGQ